MPASRLSSVAALSTRSRSHAHAQQHASRPSALFHWCAALCLALLSALPYLPSLDGAWCYDDKVAVGGNPDVVLPNVTARDLLTHDFWGCVEWMGCYEAGEVRRRRCVVALRCSPVRGDERVRKCCARYARG